MYLICISLLHLLFELTYLVLCVFLSHLFLATIQSYCVVSVNCWSTNWWLRRLRRGAQAGCGQDQPVKVMLQPWVLVLRHGVHGAVLAWRYPGLAPSSTSPAYIPMQTHHSRHKIPRSKLAFYPFLDLAVLKNPVMLCFRCIWCVSRLLMSELCTMSWELWQAVSSDAISPELRLKWHWELTSDHCQPTNSISSCHGLYIVNVNVT